MIEGLVTVVIPAYNGGELLRAAVDSVLAQSYPHIEIVVVDDGGSQDAAALLAPLPDRVRVIRQKNAGTAAARNTGIRAARGEFVALLDQDDLWDRDKLRRQLPYFEDPTVGLVHAGARFVDLEGRVTSEVPGDPTLDTHAILADCRIAVQTVVMRESALRDVGEFDTSLSAADDWDMWIRFLERYPHAAVPEPLASIRVHAGNQSRNAELMYVAAQRLFDKHRHLHGNCALCERALRAAATTNRAAYYGRLREQARDAAARGNRRDAIRLTVRALRHNPRAFASTPAHHVRSLIRRA